MIECIQLDRLPVIFRSYKVIRRTEWQITDPNHILIFCRIGSCKIEMVGKTYTLTPGDLCLIPENTLYSRHPVNDEFCELYYTHFQIPMQEMTTEMVREQIDSRKKIGNRTVSPEYPGPDHIIYLAQIVSLSMIQEELIPVLDEIIRLTNDFTLMSGPKRAVLLSSILIHAAEKTAEEVLNDNLKLTDLQIPEKLQRSVSYIREHYSEKITLDDLCRFSSVSKQQMIRYFRTSFHTTPNAYITRYKINKARELLISSHRLSVKEISYSLGFEDQCYFSRVFTKCTGETPTQYRERIHSFDEQTHISSISSADPVKAQNSEQNAP